MGQYFMMTKPLYYFVTYFPVGPFLLCLSHHCLFARDSLEIRSNIKWGSYLLPNLLVKSKFELSICSVFFQSDLESASEWEEGSMSGGITDKITKDVLYQAYVKMRQRYHKYKGRSVKTQGCNVYDLSLCWQFSTISMIPACV